MRVGVWACGIAALIALIIGVASWASYCTADPLVRMIDGTRLLVQGGMAFASAAVLIWLGVRLDRAREK